MPACPHAHEILHGLVHHDGDVARAAVDAAAKGPEHGVVVADPSELGADTAEERKAIQAARDRGGPYVAAVTVAELRAIAEDAMKHPGRESDHARCDHGGDAATIGRALLVPPPQGQVHVLGVRGSAIVLTAAHVDAAHVAELDRQERRHRRVEELADLVRPQIQDRDVQPGWVWVVCEDTEPAVAKVRGKGTVLARSDGIYLALVRAADAVAALPIEGLEDDPLGAAMKILAPLPAGSARICLLNDGHLGLAVLRHRERSRAPEGSAR
jgi:hypothetical protein